MAAHPDAWIEGFDDVAAAVPGFAIARLGTIERLSAVRVADTGCTDVVLVMRMASPDDGVAVRVRLGVVHGHLPELINGAPCAGSLRIDDLRAAQLDGVAACLAHEHRSMRLYAQTVSVALVAPPPIALTIVSDAAMIDAAVGDGPAVLILPAWTDADLAAGLAAFAALPAQALREVVAIGPLADTLHDRLDDVIVLEEAGGRIGLLTSADHADADGAWYALRVAWPELPRVAWAPPGSPLAWLLALGA